MDRIKALAKRAKQLADLPIDDLRANYPLTTETRSQLVKSCREQGFTRGEMIEAILLEEFDTDTNL